MKKGKTMSYKIAICDDSAVDANHIKHLLEAWADETARQLTIHIFDSAESFLFHYEDDSDYDILLLDVEMRGARYVAHDTYLCAPYASAGGFISEGGVYTSEMSGIELARKIRETDQSVQIIFITGYPEFALEGYDVSALHYLMKPVKREKFFEVLNRAVTALAEAPQFILLPNGKETVRVLGQNILYAESDGHYVVLHLTEDTLRLRMKIPELHTLLGEDFFRCGRSFLVGLRHVWRITRNGVVLDDRTELPLGKGLYDEMNRALVQYLRRI